MRYLSATRDRPPFPRDARPVILNFTAIGEDGRVEEA